MSLVEEGQLQNRLEEALLLILAKLAERKWNYFTKQYELVARHVEGKGRLLGDALRLLEAGLDSRTSTIRSIRDDLRGALGGLVISGFVEEGEDILVFRKGVYLRKKYRITEAGLRRLEGLRAGVLEQLSLAVTS